MVKTTQSHDTEKSIIQNFAIIVIVLALMALFIFYFFRQEKTFSEVGLNTLKSGFHAQLTVVRSQWLMDKQPTKVAFVVANANANGEQTVKYIPVNKNGWIDVVDDKNSNICEAIWLHTMDRPLALMKSSVGAVLVKQTPQIEGHICRYSISEQEYFQYNSANGQVSSPND